MQQHIDSGSLVVALITLALFIAALFMKGLPTTSFWGRGFSWSRSRSSSWLTRTEWLIHQLDKKLDTILTEVPRKDEK